LKRRGRKSASQTPAPPKDRIKGSSTNPKGSAASQSSASSITLSDKIIATLEKKKDEYNAKHSSKVSLNTLKAVMRRGMGAFSTSYRPTITGGRPNSRQAWGFARVNKFLLKKGGTKVKAAYVQDDDLMERGGVLDFGDFYIWSNKEVKKVFGSSFDEGFPIVKFLKDSDNQIVESAYGLLENGYIVVFDIDEVEWKVNDKMAKGGKIGKEITCVNCGWRWNTRDSQEFDKYVCHRCGFDNRTFYDSDPIGKYHLGGDMSKHLAPNGKPSNLTHEQWHLVRTPEFKAWFGDWENDPKNASKVVDENGEPLVVYHGTSGDLFNEFMPYAVEYVNGEAIKEFRGNRTEEEFDDYIKQYGLRKIEPRFYFSVRHIWGDKNLQCFLSIKKIYVTGEYTPKISKEYDGFIVPNEDGNDYYCVFKSNQIKLADGSNTTFDANNPDIRYEDGGDLDLFKPTKSLKELSEIHNVSIGTLSKQLIKGIKTELEHTKNEEVAKTIALHHIEENPKYYDVLKEKKLEEGGEIVVDNIIALPDTYAKEDNLKRVLNLQGYELKKIDEGVDNEDIMKKGGMVVGKSHQEADENGTGEKFVVASTGQIVELEGGEAVIVNKAMDSTDELEFDGKKMKPREIASYLNHAYGGVKFEDGGQVTCGCTKKKYYHGGELPSSVVNGLEGGEAVITKKTMDSKDKYTFEGEKLTPRQILSRINHKYGGVSFARGGITSGIKHSQENKASKMIYFLNNIIYG
jgi:hypothetical protein